MQCKVAKFFSELGETGCLGEDVAVLEPPWFYGAGSFLDLRNALWPPTGK